MAGSQRGVQDFTLKTGWVVYWPFSTQVVEYPTFMQTAVWTHSEEEGKPRNEEMTFTTKDSMVVAADVNLSYTLVPEKIPAFYVKFRSDDLDVFTHGFLRNVARDCINHVAGLYAVQDIMGNNAPFLDDARSCLQKTIDVYGVHLEQFGIIGAPRPPGNVITAINMKVQATQLALQKQNEVMQAEADAKKRVAEAQGEADAQVTRAKGEAESNRIKSSSIDDRLVSWYKLTNQHDLIWRWDGRRPQVETGSGGGLLLQLPKD